jgi:predicted N-formylglutamate amidohydrolase
LQEGQRDSAAGSSRLLCSGDEAPVAVDNLNGASPFLLVGDHAGRAIPSALASLGLAGDDLERHIAWDIGVAGLGLELVRRLDCAFVRQRYSRLVIDCNRGTDSPQSIPEISDGSMIPGNLALDRTARAARLSEIFTPYHARISEALKARSGAEQPTILLALHSFTPVMAGTKRPWRFGVLHRNDSLFSTAVLTKLREAGLGEIGDNQPYAMDGVDFTVPFHVDARGLDYLELEVRQDLISDQSGQTSIASALTPILSSALQSFTGRFSRPRAVSDKD